MGEINTGTRVPRKYVLGVHTSLGGTLILQVQEDFLKHRSGSGGFRQRSPNVLAPATGFVEDNFSADWGCGADGLGMIQAHYIYCVLYFYYYYIVTYNKIIIQLIITQNQWEP